MPTPSRFTFIYFPAFGAHSHLQTLLHHWNKSRLVHRLLPLDTSVLNESLHVNPLSVLIRYVDYIRIKHSTEF